MSETAVPASAAGKGPPMERVLEGRSMARTLLNAMRALNASLDRVCLGIGYLCGGLFLMLAFFNHLSVACPGVRLGHVPWHGPVERLRYGHGQHLGICLRPTGRGACTHRRTIALHVASGPRGSGLGGGGVDRVLRLHHRLENLAHGAQVLRARCCLQRLPPDPYLDTPVAGGHRLQHGEPDRGVHAGPRRGGGRLARLPQMGRWHRELPGGLQYLDR